MIYTGDCSRRSFLLLSLLLRLRSLFTRPLDLRPLRHLLLQHLESLPLLPTSVELLRHQYALLHRAELLALAVAAIDRLYQHCASGDIEESSAR